MRATRRAPRRGTVTVWVVACLSVLLGVAAIGMDGGRLLDERRHVQSGADAAALAAAADLYENYEANSGTDPTGTARAAALRLAAANGYANDGTNSVVTVSIPPVSGPLAGRADHVEVVIESRADAGFSRVFGHKKLSVRGRAVARGRPKTVGIVVLDPNDNDAFLQSGNGSIRVVGSVSVNSTSNVALNQSGNGVLAADGFDVVGRYVQAGTISGTVRTGADPAPDPLRALPVPNPATLPVRSSSKFTISSNGNFTMQPGVYRGGVSISSDATVTLQPGIYYVAGGGFQISGQSNITGNGVVIYNTGPSPDKIQVSGDGTLRLTAPTSGPYKGVSIFQDRAVSLELQMSGNGTTHIGGVVYAPAALVSVSGNGTVSTNSLGGGYVVNTLKVSGDSAIRIDTGPNRPRVPDVRLVD